jgi:hypothetical protein
MKKIKLFLFLMSIVLVTACKKNGEIVKNPSFGTLNITGTLSNPLIVKVDGKIIDTLNSGGDLSKPVEEGSHKITLSDSTNKPVIDTTLKFARAKITSLSNFFYTGYGILFPDPDTARKPSPGKMLIRLVITDKSLPDKLNLELFILNFSSGVSTPLNVKINGVGKDKFSNYIEVDNPGSGDSYYVVEGYDLNGNKKMSIDNNTYGFLVSDSNYTPFTENSIVSIGIGPGDEFNPSHIPQVIFQRVAQ